MSGTRKTIIDFLIRNAHHERKRPIINSTGDYNFVHVCTLKSSIDESLRLRPKWLGEMIASESQPRTKQYFTSIKKLENEIYRQINGPYWYIIHPLSKFIILWDHIMFVVHLINWYIVLFQIANQKYLTVLSAKINFAIQFPCYINIASTFFIGYCTKYDIIIDQRTIASHYLKTWFFTDVITSIPFQAVQILLANRVDEMTLNVLILYQSLKILTFGRLRRHFKNILQFWKLSYACYMILLLVLVSLLTFHATATLYQVGGNLFVINDPNTDIPLNKIALNESTPNIGMFWYRYLLCMYIMSLNFYCFAFAFKDTKSNPPLFYLAVDLPVIFISYIYQLYALVKVIQLFQFQHSTKIKYQEIVNQLEQYMRTKHMPLKIKKSLIEFYEQRYQYRFFKERAINENLSDPLRHELQFHSGQLFVKSMPIFNNVSNVNLNKIVSCLLPEIYMPNDLIIRAGTIGDCMFFIASGTVSIRSTTGEEIIHLEDGDHFGEISLFSKQGQRVSNIVAIEYCEVYRLNKKDYETNIVVIPELASKFEELGKRRASETSTVEEKYKDERDKKYRSDDTDDDDVTDGTASQDFL